MPLGLRLSARLMEGATLGCPLTDRCQQRPLSSKHQAGCANLASGGGKDDDDTGDRSVG